MCFGKLIRETWNNASAQGKQQVNSFSHNESSIMPVSEQHAQSQKKPENSPISIAFELLETNFSQCLLTKPILNEPLDEQLPKEKE